MDWDKYDNFWIFIRRSFLSRQHNAFAPSLGALLQLGCPNPYGDCFLDEFLRKEPSWNELICRSEATEP